VHDPFQLEGRVLDGKYRLEGVLGEGGFGVVYAGRQLALDQPVAVKCLKPGSGDSGASFLREARVLFQLSHPGIVRMYDVGEIQTSSGPMPYVVLERLAGRTLDEEIVVRTRERRPFSSVELAQLADSLLDALAFAHAQGVVHRDIKPSNVMLVPGPSGPTTKILDFGLARGGMGNSVTTGGVGLTPQYAAPEQWNANYGAIGPATDLFALGLVLEEAATFVPALAGESIADVVASTTSLTRRSRVSERRPDLPPGFADVVNRATRVAQSERFPSAGAMRELLRTLVSAPRPSGYGAVRAGSMAPSSPLAASYSLVPSPRASSVPGAPTFVQGPTHGPPSGPPPTAVPALGYAPPGPPIGPGGPAVLVGSPGFHGPPPAAAYDASRGKGNNGGIIGGVVAAVAIAGFFAVAIAAGAGYAVYRFVAESTPRSSPPPVAVSTAVTPPVDSPASAATALAPAPSPSPSQRGTKPGPGPGPAPAPSPSPVPTPPAAPTPTPSAPSAPVAPKAYAIRIVSAADLGAKDGDVSAAVQQAGTKIQYCFEGPGRTGRAWNVVFRKSLSGGGYGLGKSVTRLDGQVRSLDEGGPASDLRNCTDNALAMMAFPVPPPVKLPDGGTRTPYVEFFVGRE